MKKFLAILLAMLTLLSLCACGGEKEINPDADTTVAAEAEDNTKKEDDKKKPEKIEDFSTDRYFSGFYSGFIYSKDDMEGLISYDGTNDTGAKYYDLSSSGYNNYIVAKTKEYTTPDDLDSLNDMMLIDSFGNEIISENFAEIEMISDKFAVCAKIVEQTTDESDYDFFLTSNRFNMSADEGDMLYNAEYYVYDVTTGQKVDGAMAGDDNFHAYGDIIKYGTYSFEEEYINSKGEKLPEEAEEIESFDGCYLIEEDENGTIYDAFGNALFTYSRTSGYIPEKKENGYIICKDSDNGTLALFDETGTMASAEIPVSENYWMTDIEGNLIIVYNSSDALDGIYDFEGNLIKECDFFSIKNNKEYYFIETDDEGVIIIGKDGEVLFEASAEEAEEINCYDSIAYKDVEDENYYFCVKDKDFTVKGDSIGKSQYVAVENKDESVDMVDTITGKTVLEGYKSYVSAVNGDDVYILAKGENKYDLYKI